MDLTSITEHLDEVRLRLEEIEKERSLLETMLKAGTEWVNLNKVGRQLELPVEAALSFPKGVEKVLRDAGGETLTDEEIWDRMQALGIRSNGKRPANYVSLHAGKLDGVEMVKKGEYRWASGSDEQTI